MIVIPADSCTPYLQPQQFGVRDVPLPDDPPHFVNQWRRRLRKEAWWDSDHGTFRRSRDGVCSIIYKIIMGIELYNNNGRSIIIFYTLHKGLCRESCIKYSKRDFIHPLSGEFPRDLVGLVP
jgi:hypothetical protein